MRKIIALVLGLAIIAGSALAINNSGVLSSKRAANTTTTRTQVQPQVENLIDIATVEPTGTPVVTEAPVVTPTPAPAATEAPVAEVVDEEPVVAEPVVVNEPDHNAMSFMDWLQKAQSTPTGALNGIFDEEHATRVNFVEEEISGYATFEVAGSYFSTKVDGYQFTAGHKSASEVTFISCEEHPGMFFDWTTRYNGDLVRYELTSELVSELKEVAVYWQDEADNTVYGILLCQHNGSSSPATSSNAGNGGNGGNGGEQPIVTPEPTKEPTATPAPLPEAPEEEDVPEEEDPIVTQPPVENNPEYSDTEETTVPEEEDPIIVGTPVDNTPTYNDESATTDTSSTTDNDDNAGKQESTSQQQAAPLMAAPLQEVESAPAQEQTVQAAEDPIVVTESVQEAPVQEMAPLMPAPLAPVE